MHGASLYFRPRKTRPRLTGSSLLQGDKTLPQRVQKIIQTDSRLPYNTPLRARNRDEAFVTGEPDMRTSLPNYSEPESFQNSNHIESGKIAGQLHLSISTGSATK